MQRNDIGFLQKRFFIYKSHAFDSFRSSVPGQHLAAKGVEQLGYALTDVTHADDAHGLAADLTAWHIAFALALTGDAVVLQHLAVHIDHHGNGQFSDGLSGIAGSILHDDTPTLAFLHVDMVQSREGDGEHLQFGTGIQEVFP